MEKKGMSAYFLLLAYRTLEIFFSRYGVKMFKDKDGKIYSDLEYYNKRISEINIDPEGTEEINQRVNEILLVVNELAKCKQLYRKFDEKSRYLRAHLDEESIKCVCEIEGCFKDILTIFQEYLYLQGYRDGMKFD
jgi:hypothetical protein